MKESAECVWKDIIEAIPCLCWGVLILIGLIFFVKYAQPTIDTWIKYKMKANILKPEKGEHNNNQIQGNSEIANELIETKKELEEKKIELDLVNKQLNIYKTIFKDLNIEIRPKENKQKD